jgi:thymidine kinase
MLDDWRDRRRVDAPVSAMNHPSTPIRLEVICGPMFAGKTTELMSRIAQAQSAGMRVLTVKPTRDTRYGHSEIVTHTGLRVPALAVDRIADVLEHTHDFVAIDEIHFFAAEAVAPIQALLARGTRVVVAGCDIDHFGDVFAPFDALIPMADSVTRITGTCARCGAPSTHSERISAVTDRIIVGGIGDFHATCAACFRPSVRPPA